MQHQDATLAKLKAVRKRYGRSTALDGVDLEVRPGEVLALLGANGAGKSTAVGVLLGLVAPDGGEASLFGQPPGSMAVRRRTGVMLQSADIPEACKVGELLELTRSYYPAPLEAAECVAMAGLDGLLDRRYGRLSGGQKRRVQFALAVCGRPQLLFLDEPTTGLDLEARQGLWRAIRVLVAQGSSVLLTTHYLEEAEALGDRVVVLHRGRVLAEGGMEEVRAHVSRRRIRCVSALDAATVGAWPQVSSAQRDGDRLEIVVGGAAETVVRRLLSLDRTLGELEIQRAGLAEAFIELTREPGDGLTDLQQQEAA
ncbi:MAG: ABC transporter ATP-binding protein [Pseudomonadota bacterium]|nr:ABC transporter ATP-binding protein [Pseudomonadota bacterium]